MSSSYSTSRRGTTMTTATKTRLDAGSNSLVARNRGTTIRVFLRMGKLDFGIHGILGIASLLLTTASLLLSSMLLWLDDVDTDHNSTATTSYSFRINNNDDNSNNNNNMWMFVLLLVLSQICNWCLVVHAGNTLLQQVPTQTSWLNGWIVAPHKHAFARTIAMMQYLVVRVSVMFMGQYYCRQQLSDERLFKYIIAYPLLLFHGWPMAPTALFMEFGKIPRVIISRQEHSDNTSSSSTASSSLVSNGNSWIFVFPMFVGVLGDLYQYEYYNDLFQLHHLLYGQLLGLCLAFGFTLAFRKYISMSFVYVGAAIGVWTILQEGIRIVNETTITTTDTLLSV